MQSTERDPLRALVRLLARDAAREWLAAPEALPPAANDNEAVATIATNGTEEEEEG